MNNNEKWISSQDQQKLFYLKNISKIEIRPDDHLDHYFIYIDDSFAGEYESHSQAEDVLVKIVKWSNSDDSTSFTLPLKRRFY